MKVVFRTVVSLIILQCIGCSGLHKQDNYFSQFVNSKGQWVSHKKKSTGEIVIIYNERSNSEVPKVEVQVNKLAGVIYSKYEKSSSLYCHYKYTFNKSRALIHTEKLLNTCRLQLK